MEEDLVARLRANSGVAALVALRGARPAVDWQERGEELPCVTMEMVAPGFGYTFAGADALKGATVQFDCWATSFAAATLLERAVIVALAPAATFGNTQFDAGFVLASRSRQPEDLGGGIKVFRKSLDLAVWHRPA